MISAGILARRGRPATRRRVGSVMYDMPLTLRPPGLGRLSGELSAIPPFPLTEGSYWVRSMGRTTEPLRDAAGWHTSWSTATPTSRPAPSGRWVGVYGWWWHTVMCEVSPWSVLRAVLTVVLCRGRRADARGAAEQM